MAVVASQTVKAAARSYEFPYFAYIEQQIKTARPLTHRSKYTRKLTHWATVCCWLCVDISNRFGDIPVACFVSVGQSSGIAIWTISQCKRIMSCQPGVPVMRMFGLVLTTSDIAIEFFLLPFTTTWTNPNIRKLAPSKEISKLIFWWAPTAGHVACIVSGTYRLIHATLESFWGKFGFKLVKLTMSTLCGRRQRTIISDVEWCCVSN